MTFGKWFWVAPASVRGPGKTWPLAVLLVLACASRHLSAADDYTWIGAGATNAWSDAGNWQGGVVPPDDGTAHIIFKTVTNEKVALDGNRRVHSITCITTTSFQINSVEDAVEILTIDTGLVERTVEGTLNFKCALGGNNGMHFVGLVGPQTHANKGERFWIWGQGFYKGETRATNCVLRAMGHADRIPDSSRLVIEAGAIFDMHGRNEVVGGLEGGGVITNTLPSINTLTIGLDDLDAEFSGSIGTPIPTQGRTFNLIKRGLGKQTLSGTNEWIGATIVMAGTLQADSDLPPTTLTGGPGSGGGGGGDVATVGSRAHEPGEGGEEEEPHGGPPPTGLVEVHDGAMLTGSGAVGDLVTLRSPAQGGTVSPGNGVGSMTAESANMSGGFLRVQLPALGTAGTNYDRLAVTGALTLDPCSQLIVDLNGFTGTGTFAGVITFATAPALSYDPKHITVLNAQSNQAVSVTLDADSLDVVVSNTGPAAPGVTLSPSCGLITTEDGVTATFDVTLDTPPTAPVTIDFISGDSSEGVATAQVTFDTGDQGPRTVTLTGQDDAEVDGNIAYSISGTISASGLDYAAVIVPAVTAVNLDNDGLTVAPSGTLETWERAGAAALFTVVLNAAPVEDVIVPIYPRDLTEGSVFPDRLVFSVDNWSLPQKVSVFGLPDGIADGDILYDVGVGPCLSQDPVFSQVAASSVPVLNRDVETLLPGVTVTTGADLQTAEDGDTAAFTVVLTSIPAGDVIIPLISTDAGEGVPVPGSLLFRPTNALTPQTVTVYGVDDADPDGDQPYEVQTFPAISADPFYSGFNADDVGLTNLDDEAGSGIRVSLTSSPSISEDGGVATFEVVLRSEPAAGTQVDIALSVSDPARAMLSHSGLTFLPGEALIPQTVTVTALDNRRVEGNTPFYVILDPAVSGDSDYNGIDPTDQAFLAVEDDKAGILVTPIAGLVTSEDGASDTFTIALASIPSATVSVAILSSLPIEGNVFPTVVVFSPDMTALDPQTITVSGADDPDHDGSIPYLVVTEPATSADANYQGLDPQDVWALNLDNDDAPPFIDSLPYAFPNPAGVGQPVTFFLAAADPEGVELTITWDYGDGSSDKAGQHTYATPNTYHVVATISDGTHSITAELDVVVQSQSEELYVRRLSGNARFGSADRDSVLVSAYLRGIPESLDLNGLTLTAAVGGAQFSVVLDAKGFGRVGRSRASVRRLRGTDMTLVTVTMNGALRDAWVDEGVVPGTPPPFTFTTMQVTMTLDGYSYSGSPRVLLRGNRTGLIGTFKYSRN